MPRTPVPTDKQRADVEAAFQAVIDAIEEHEAWTPPNPHKTLFYVWDFANRSKYMISEYENIKDGKPLQHPEQFRPAPGKGEQAAAKVFADSCARTMMVQTLVNDKSGKTAMMTGQSGAPVEFTQKIKDAVDNLMKIIPGDILMAGFFS
ncbi:hypothetical protein B7463_g12189, partial [Scytalidium lignicola]